MDQEARKRIIRFLHPSRMRLYLEVSGGNHKKALALYRWHSQLTAAVQEILGITEVVLRNALDEQIQRWNDSELGAEGGSWLLTEPAAPLRSLSASKRRLAMDWAQKAARNRSSGHPRFGIPVDHDDVLAQVAFGLWKDLLPNHAPDAGQNEPNRNRKRLWTEALHHAFPEVQDASGELTYWRVTRVHHLRNRVAHMEPLLSIDVRAEIQQAFDLLRSIDARVADWVTGLSRVSFVLSQSPLSSDFPK